MIIEDEDKTQGRTQIINLPFLKQVVSVYKMPLTLGGIGIVLLIVAVGLVVKTVHTAPEVVFTTSSTSSAQVKIRIDIQGAIMSPGVYMLEEGSRVGDALTISGGLAEGADRQWVAKNLNRAAKLIDGGKIYIPSTVETSTAQSNPSAGGPNQTSQSNLSNLSNPTNLLGVTINLVNINSASQAEVEALPGIGPVTANKIIAGRPYQTVEELKNRKIIGQSLYNKIKDLLTI